MFEDAPLAYAFGTRDRQLSSVQLWLVKFAKQGYMYNQLGRGPLVLEMLTMLYNLFCLERASRLAWQCILSWGNTHTLRRDDE